MAPQDNTPWWKKLLGASSDVADSSGNVLDNILSMAGKKADSPLVEMLGSKPHDLTHGLGAEVEEEVTRAQATLKTAQSVLALVVGLGVIVSAALYVYVFDTENALLSKFNIQNLPAELATKEGIHQTLQKDLADTQRFIALMRLEAVATKITNLDIDDSALNYRVPLDGPVPHPDNGEPSYRVTDERGNTVYVRESEINQKKTTRAERMGFVKAALQQIMLIAEDLQSNTKLPGKFETAAKTLIGHLAEVNLDEQNFPSPASADSVHLAQGIAREILAEVKEKNLGNLVTDLQKQAHAIDISTADDQTKAVVATLVAALDSVSITKPSSLVEANTKLKTLDISAVKDDAIYSKIIQIIGDNDTRTGDLTDASQIAANLSRETTINKLDAGRVAWSSIIDNVEGIARLGADLTPAQPGEPVDVRRDIDPNSKVFVFTGYSAKADRNEIEVRGRTVGKGSYDGKNFTALADLADALEASKSFKDVEAISYSKSKDLSGVISSPISMKLGIEKASEVDKRDLVIKKVTDQKPVVPSTPKPTTPIINGTTDVKPTTPVAPAASADTPAPQDAVVPAAPTPVTAEPAPTAPIPVATESLTPDALATLDAILK